MSVKVILRFIGIFLICSSYTEAQLPLELRNTVRLPSSSRGSFGGGFPFVGDDSYIGTRLRVLPDQSLLILLPNANGSWALEHVTRWWTPQPGIDTLNTAGWSGANARRGKSVQTSLLVTEDGKYALTIGTISDGIQDLRHIPAPPTKPLSSQADALFTVVNLHTWRVVKTLHLSTIAEESLYGAQLVGSNILLETNQPVSDRPPYNHLYERTHRLLTVPDFDEGPRCTTKEIPYELYNSDLEAKAKAIVATNNEACSALLARTNLRTALDLEFKTFLNQQAEPEHVLKDAIASNAYQLPHPQNSGPPSETATILGFIGQDFEKDKFRYLSGSESIFAWNPAFQTDDGLWFSFNSYGEGATYHYVLNKYDSDGQLLASQSADDLIALSTKDGCGCKVVAVSATRHMILAQCRNWKVDLGGADYASKQWVGIIDADSLKLQAESVISTDYAQRVAMAIADGRAYALVLTHGSTLSVYAEPHPNTIAVTPSSR